MRFEVLFNGSFRINRPGFVFVHELPDPTFGPSDWPVPPHWSVLTNKIVQTDQRMHCHIYWNAEGNLHDLLDGVAEWRCRIYFEKWGSNEHTPGFYEKIIPIKAGGARGTNYAATITIPAQMTEGIVKPVCTVNLQTIVGKKPLPVAGFEEAEFLQFYRS